MSGHMNTERLPWLYLTFLKGLYLKILLHRTSAIAYSEWRLELASESYVKSASPSASQSCFASLESITKLGTNLQRLMNKLNAELACLRRARLANAARDAADSIDEDSDRQSLFSGDRSCAGDSCDDDDNVYKTKTAVGDVAVNDDIQGKSHSEAHRAVLTMMVSLFHFRDDQISQNMSLA